MKKNKIFILLLLITIPFLFKFNVDAFEDEYIQLLNDVNTPIVVDNSLCENYTKSDNGINIYDFNNFNIENYAVEDYGFCGGLIDYRIDNFIFYEIKYADVSFDDPIISFIPKELFKHRGVYTYIGEEYGFFVNCKQYSDDEDYELINEVDIFLFDIEKSYQNYKFSYAIIPLYTFSYIYINQYYFDNFENDSSLEIYDVNIDISNAISNGYNDLVIPVPEIKELGTSNSVQFVQDYYKTRKNEFKYAIKNSSMDLMILNKREKNTFDTGYESQKDNGFAITRSYMNFVGYKCSPNSRLSYLNSTDSLYEQVNSFITGTSDLLSLISVLGTLYNEYIPYYVDNNYVDHSLTYELNNPTEVYKGDKKNQLKLDSKLWKIDSRGITSDSNTAIVFKSPLSLDDTQNNTNYIVYNWDFDFGHDILTSLNYGIYIEIAILNEETDSYNHLDDGHNNFNMTIGEEQQYELTLQSEEEGYMLFGDNFQRFFFDSEFTSIYSIISENSEIKIYNSSNSLIYNGFNQIECSFIKGQIYYIEIGRYPVQNKSYCFTVRLDVISISNVQQYELNNLIPEHNSKSIFKFNCNYTNLYNLSIKYNGSNYIDFEIFDMNMELIKKIDINEEGILAKTSDINKNILAKLYEGNSYYICFNNMISQNLIFEISNYSNEIVLNTSHDEQCGSEDKLFFFKTPFNSRYQVEFSYVNDDFVQNNMIIFLYTYINGELLMIDYVKCNALSSIDTKIIILPRNSLVYVGYINGNSSLQFLFSVEESPSYLFNVTTETNYANVSSGIGTEVSINKGNRYDNTIEVGFTRVLYLSSNAAFSSRLNDYYWESTNANVATVSQYGTVFAKSVGRTIIRVTDKYNKYHLATLEIVVYSNDNPPRSVISLSTDMNEDNKQNGTEVTLNSGIPGGTEISIGYTRSICIVAGGPTNLRQDYLWYSSDTSIAIVDQYGYVKGISTGVVTISCINKYNSKYVSSITFSII